MHAAGTLRRIDMKGGMVAEEMEKREIHVLTQRMRAEDSRLDDVDKDGHKSVQHAFSG